MMFSILIYCLSYTTDNQRWNGNKYSIHVRMIFSKKENTFPKDTRFESYKENNSMICDWSLPE